MHFVGVFNRDGGTFRSMDMEAFCDSARRIFEMHGDTLECRVVAGHMISEALEQGARDAGDGVLLAGGGDGTISAAAAIAFRTGVVLAVLPAGTMNLFARALRLPLSLRETLEALAAGEVQSVDIATANEWAFVHQFGVGIHARLIRIRDHMTYRSRWGKMLASVRSVTGAIVRPPPRFHVEIRSSEGAAKRMVSGIAVSNNRAGDGHIPYADVLDQGVLGVYVAAPMSRVSLIRLLIGVLIGRWRAHPSVVEMEVSAVTLDFPRRKHSAQAVIDGELFNLPGRVVLRIHPGALRVVVPAGA
ncbi:MAG TPA: diacylglycerol kinase family protein [Devosiaceae bacterium]|jgi:diacylglycerol kinase family enzyme